ncbi:MAG: hypothetical protein GY749_29405, partial [Desulfobacteraceae bacterium]|nr:hypothetical protein [Desulfobacteraceae bacterium]
MLRLVCVHQNAIVVVQEIRRDARQIILPIHRKPLAQERAKYIVEPRIGPVMPAISDEKDVQAIARVLRDGKKGENERRNEGEHASTILEVINCGELRGHGAPTTFLESHGWNSPRIGLHMEAPEAGSGCQAPGILGCISMKKLGLVVVVVLATVGHWACLLRPVEDGSPAVEATAEVALARDRAAAFFEAKDLKRAREVVAPLIEGAGAAAEDLVRAAVIDYHDRAEQNPSPLLDRLQARDPMNAALHFMLAQVSIENGEYEKASEHYRVVLRSEPDDLASQLGLALVLDDLDEVEEAEQLLRCVAELGVEQGGPWTVTAVYRLYQMAQADERKADEQRYLELYEQLESLGYKALAPTQRDRGSLAIVQPATPSGIGPAKPGPPPSFRREAAILPEFAGARELFAYDLDGDDDIDFVAAGPNGLLCALREGTKYRVETILEDPVEHVRVFDLGNDDTMDLLV